MSTVRPQFSIGILGGMGPAASTHLLKKLVEFSQKLFGASQDEDFPEMMLLSVPLHDWDTTGLRDTDSVRSQLVRAVRRIEHTGADFIVPACNTIHALFNDMQSAVDIPIINMIEEVAEECARVGAKHVGVLATESSNRYQLYQNALRSRGIVPFSASDQEQREVTTVIGHAEQGCVSEADVELLLRIIRRMHTDGVDSAILGCTELPLVLCQDQSEITVFSSTDIVAKKAIELAYCRKIDKYKNSNKVLSSISPIR